MDPAFHTFRVTIDKDDPIAYKRLAEKWFTAFSESIAPDMWEHLIQGDESVDSAMTVVPHPGGPIETMRFDLKEFRERLAVVDRPAESLTVGGEFGDGRRLSIGVDWSQELSIRLRGDVTMSPAEFDAERCVNFMTSFLDEVDPAFGYVSTDFGAGFHTALDLTLRRNVVESFSASRDILRGYTWLTIIPKELVARLGGSAALTGSGMAGVHPLAAGGVVLVASSSPDHYSDEVMRKQFALLAPVLPAGKPRPLFGYEHLRVVHEDAATYGAGLADHRRRGLAVPVNPLD